MFMLMKPLLLLTVSFITSFSIPHAHKSKDKIQWLTVEEVEVRMKVDPRPIIIDLYAKWCYWCKVMDKRTYNNGKVAGYINEKFYPVKVDAETRQTIAWKNKQFAFNPEAKMNDFTLYLTNGQLSFPTTVIITSLNEAPATIPGYMAPDEIEPILKYFGDDHYRTQGFQEFLKRFKRDW